MMIDVVGPIKTWNTLKFVVIREFASKTGGFVLRFEIIKDLRSGKWLHFGWADQRDSLCYERLYMPERDCACIRACKERLKNG